MRKQIIPNYTVDELSKQIDPYAIKNFIVTDVNRKVPPFLYEYPHTLGGIAFSICTNGHAQFKVNMQELTMVPNNIITILPNFIVEPIEKSSDFFLETLFFSFDFISDLPLSSNFDIMEKIEQTPCLYISEEEVNNLLNFHAFIVGQYNRKEHQYRQEIAKYLLFALITEIGSLYSKAEKTLLKLTRAEKLTSRFFILLRRYHKTERNIDFYADKLYLTPKYLTTIIKRNTGKTIINWMHEADIAAIKVLLKSSDKTIGQISDELNFSDTSVLCRFFKKHTGMTPKGYRESGVNVIITNKI